jgi:hypothetical protein
MPVILLTQRIDVDRTRSAGAGQDAQGPRNPLRIEKRI